MRERRVSKITPVLIEKIEKGDIGILGYQGLVKCKAGNVVQVYAKHEIGKMLPMMAQIMLRDEMNKANSEMQMGEIKTINIDDKDYEVLKSNKGPTIIKRVITKN